MGSPRLDTSVWNLGVPVALLAACGPIVGIGETDGDSADTSATDPDSGPDSLTSPTTMTTASTMTTVGTTTPTECNYDQDCPPGYRCDNNKCYYDGYCADGGCCYEGCCGEGYGGEFGGCYYDCSYNTDCGPGYQCYYNNCQAVTPEVGCESVPFAIGFEIPVAGGISSLAFIETDGNNERELVVAGAGVTLARIDGTTTVLDGTSAPYDLEVRDLDGDGDEDIVMLDGNTGLVRLLLNDGMWTAVELPYGGSFERVETVDLGGDGFPDVVAVSSIDGIYVWRNNGGNGWEDPTYIWEASSSIAAGALDGDALEDIVAHSYTTYALYDGAINATALYSGSYGGVRQVAIGNFNGSGDLDVITTEVNGTTLATSFPGSVLSGSGSLTTSWPNAVETIEVADMNLDGFDDVVGGGGSALTIAYGGPQADADTIVCVSSVASPHTPYRVAIGDMSGDGRPDLAVSDFNIAYVMLRTD